MTNKTAANRYARALFDVAVKERADLDAIDAQLAAFTGLFAQYPTLEAALLNPAVPAPRKREAVAQIVKSGGLMPIVAKLMLLLAERDRLVLLPDLVAAFRSRLLDHQRVVRADVATATPISGERTKAIENSLARITGRTVQLSTRVDPGLVGGLVARIGGTVYDASVTKQLKKMKQRLDEGV